MLHLSLREAKLLFITEIAPAELSWLDPPLLQNNAPIGAGMVKS